MRKGSDIQRRPDLLLADLVQREARGGDELKWLQRAVVLAVDHEGAKLQNADGSGKVTVGNRSFKALVGPENPRGSVKARILTDGFDRLLRDDDVRVFWPLFPYDQFSLPVSPGEHVYVIFEGEGFAHGLWLSRVSGHDSANISPGVDSYTAASNQPSAMDSFQENPSDYPKDDDYASQAPDANNAVKAFLGDS